MLGLAKKKPKMGVNRISKKQAAEFLGVTLRRVQQLAAAGQFGKLRGRRGFIGLIELFAYSAMVDSRFQGVHGHQIRLTGHQGCNCVSLVAMACGDPGCDFCRDDSVLFAQWSEGLHQKESLQEVS